MNTSPRKEWIEFSAMVDPLGNSLLTNQSSRELPLHMVRIVYNNVYFVTNLRIRYSGHINNFIVQPCLTLVFWTYNENGGRKDCYKSFLIGTRPRLILRSKSVSWRVMERQKEVVGFDAQPRVVQLVRWKLERIILEDAYISYGTDTCYDTRRLMWVCMYTRGTKQFLISK